MRMAGVTQEDLDRAFARQQELFASGSRQQLGSVMKDMGLLSEEMLQRILESYNTDV
jgi:hypothetical protein